MDLKLMTLGELSLAGAAFARAKPLLLLAYLALEGARDKHHLSELFWPGSANPLNSLAAALMQLRQGAPGVIEVDKRQVRSTVACDAGELLGAFEGGRYEEALLLYRGPFLNGVYLPGWSAELEEWVYGTREFVGARVREVLLRLGEGEAARGEFTAAVKRAEAAYLLAGASEPEPEDLERFHSLLAAGESAQLARLRKEARSYGLELSLSPAEARERLRQEPPSPLPTLPSAATSFIGRDVERVEVGNLLTQAECSLLTLTGPGGVGKSRLALRVAHDLIGRFAGGAHFVPLEALTSPGLIPARVAEALVLPLQGGEDPLVQVIRHIGDKATLLVLDNYEHLLDGAGVVSGMLRACPKLKVLVTSRERLSLEEEWVLPLEGLAVPPPNASPADAQYHGALRLFLDRAKRAKLSFELTAEDVPHVVRICNTVQGLPLGIELAAAWVKLLSCREIGEEVENIDFLASPNRNAAERHKSIRTVFGGSWRRLTPKEQEVLRRLSVFRGGFTREDVAEVAGATIPVLASLVDKSLLRVSASSRYDLHPLLHQYTKEKLAADEDEQRETEQRHAALFLALAEEAEPHLAGARQAVWLERLEAEHDNLRTALAWLREHDEVERVLRLGGALARFWLIRGHTSEGMAQLEAVLVHPRAVEPSLARAKILHGVGVMTWFGGNNMLARSRLEESVRMRRELGDKQGAASSLGYLGGMAFRQGNYEAARSLYEESVALSQELGDKQSIAVGLMHLGVVVREQGDLAYARSLQERCLTVFRELGDKRSMAYTLHNLGGLAYGQGDYAAARSFHEESLAISREVGHQIGIAGALSNLGLVVLEQGKHAAARALFDESLTIYREIDLKGGFVYCLEGLAGVATAQAEPSRAARLLGAAEALRQAISAPLLASERPRYERTVAAARAQLGEAAFTAAWAQGQMMSLEKAISCALEEVK